MKFLNFLESKYISDNQISKIKPENYKVISVNQKYLGFQDIRGIHHLIDTRFAIHGNRNGKFILLILDIMMENEIQFELEVSDQRWIGSDGVFTKFSKDTFLIGN